MLHWLLTARVDKQPFLVGSLVVGGLLLAFLAIRTSRAHWWRTVAIAAVAGIAVGLLAGWLVSDVFNVFGISFSPVTRAWICYLCVGIALAIVNLRGSRWWRRAVAIVAIPAVVIVAATWINVDFGGYRDLRDALGISPDPPMAARYLGGKAVDTGPQAVDAWTPPSGQPSQGIVRTVDIPATVSHFRARAAFVYLPPAALVAHPAVLPVVVMLSGQPGAPSDMFELGDAARYLNAYAAAHRGIAPIVVAPDQLGAADHNPMCVDSPLGNAASYVTRDVPAWIRAHLAVPSDRRYWAIAGFSEGGTCAMQFGASANSDFESILSISGEIAPADGPSTVREAFHGSAAAYAAAAPIALLERNGPFPGTLALFGVGADDTRYLGWERRISAAAAAAGMTTKTVVSPGSAHDWNTVKYVLDSEIPTLSDHLLGQPAS